MLLQGVRVLDFGWVWAGAVPGQMLAFLGAEVIKVETRKRLDYMRQGRAIVKDAPDTEQQPMFHNINRGKLSLSIDFTTDAGRDLLLDLAAHCDVSIENFAPGVLDRYGLGYEALRERRPDLVMLSMSGGGQQGPLRELRSYASTIAAFSGLDSLCGYPGEEPLGVQQSYPDPNASLHGAVAVLAALIRRKRSGRGDHIDLSQLAAGLQTSAEAMAWLDLFGEAPGPLGNLPPNDEPLHDCFRCAGEDEWIAVAAEDEAQLAAVAALTGAPSGDPTAVRDALERWCAAARPARRDGRAAGRRRARRRRHHRERPLRGPALPRARHLRGDGAPGDRLGAGLPRPLDLAGRDPARQRPRPADGRAQRVRRLRAARPPPRGPRAPHGGAGAVLTGALRPPRPLRERGRG